MQLIFISIILNLTLLFHTTLGNENLNDTIDNSPTYFETIGDDFTKAYGDLKFLGKGVLNTDWNHVLTLASLVGVSYGISYYDKDIRDYYLEVKQDEDKFSYKALSVIDYFGSIPFADGVAVGTYLTGLFIDDEYVRTSGRLLVESMVLSGFLAISLRVATGRERPFPENNNYNFNPFTLKYRNHSFPSGHVTLGFTLATMLSERIDRWWAYTGLYALAGLNALSRIYFVGHWSSDILISAALGSMSAFAILKANDNREKQEKENYTWSISPLGIHFSYSF